MGVSLDHTRNLEQGVNIDSAVYMCGINIALKNLIKCKNSTNTKQNEYKSQVKVCSLKQVMFWKSRQHTLT